MNLHALLLEREAAARPVTVGLIGAGKFGTMFLSQARLTKGMHVVAVADLNVGRAQSQLASAGWPPGGCQLGLRPPDVEIGDCNDVHTFRQPRLG